MLAVPLGGGTTGKTVETTYTTSAAACDMWHDVVEGIALIGYSRKHIMYPPMQLCKEFCVSEDTFMCMSFDYHMPTSTCYLLDVTVATRPDAVVYIDAYSHGERNLDCIGVYQSTICNIFMNYQFP